MTGRIDSVNAYMKARVERENGKCLALVTDDIILSSSRDGQYKGRDQFEKYLKQIKPQGEFKQPALDGDIVNVEGHVKLLGIRVPIVVKFTFRDEQICTITVAKNIF